MRKGSYLVAHLFDPLSGPEPRSEDFFMRIASSDRLLGCWRIRNATAHGALESPWCITCSECARSLVPCLGTRRSAAPLARARTARSVLLALLVASALAFAGAVGGERRAGLEPGTVDLGVGAIGRLGDLGGGRFARDRRAGRGRRGLSARLACSGARPGGNRGGLGSRGRCWVRLAARRSRSGGAGCGSRGGWRLGAASTA